MYLFRRSATSETSVSLAERLGNALTIYSNDLTGLIILVDRHMFQSKDQIREYLGHILNILFNDIDVCNQFCLNCNSQNLNFNETLFL